MKYPIVLGTQDGKPAWLTVGGGMPTLARVVGLDDRPPQTTFPPR